MWPLLALLGEGEGDVAGGGGGWARSEAVSGCPRGGRTGDSVPRVDGRKGDPSSSANPACPCESRWAANDGTPPGVLNTVPRSRPAAEADDATRAAVGGLPAECGVNDGVYDGALEAAPDAAMALAPRAAAVAAEEAPMVPVPLAER